MSGTLTPSGSSARATGCHPGLRSTDRAEVLDPEARLLHARPDGPVRAVRNAIRNSIGDTLGEIPEKAEGFTPHVSVAYSAQDGPTSPITQILDGLNLSPAQAR